MRLPAGFTLLAVDARAGWSFTAGDNTVSWSADKPEHGVAAKERAFFVLKGRLPDKPGTLWFKVLQTCDVGSEDWAEIPTEQGPKPASPAAKLEVIPAQ